MMSATITFRQHLSSQEHVLISRLDTPAAIQNFLDGIPYSAEEVYRCPLRVLRDGRAHCFDGAVFAAGMLYRIGYPPLLVDMLPENDDDHVLAVFQRDGCWGAVAKSNFVGLRFREPVYRSLRELVMSYFDVFYNLAYQKTLRGYTTPLNLEAFDPFDWMSRDEAMEAIAKRLERIRKVSVITPAQVAALIPVDERTYQSGLLGTDTAGLYQPKG